MLPAFFHTFWCSPNTCRSVTDHLVSLAHGHRLFYDMDRAGTQIGAASREGLQKDLLVYQTRVFPVSNLPWYVMSLHIQEFLRVLYASVRSFTRLVRVFSLPNVVGRPRAVGLHGTLDAYWTDILATEPVRGPSGRHQTYASILLFTRLVRVSLPRVFVRRVLDAHSRH